jgi:hypothetical protein
MLCQMVPQQATAPPAFRAHDSHDLRRHSLVLSRRQQRRINKSDRQQHKRTRIAKLQHRSRVRTCRRSGRTIPNHGIDAAELKSIVAKKRRKAQRCTVKPAPKVLHGFHNLPNQQIMLRNQISPFEKPFCSCLSLLQTRFGR